MASSTHPCFLLEIPPKLRAITYIHDYYDAAPLAINHTTRHFEIFRELLIFCPQVYKHSNPIFTSRFMIREAYPMYADVLRWRIADCESKR